MKSSHQKRRFTQKSCSYQRLNIESIMPSQRSPQKSILYEKGNFYPYQNSLIKKNKFLVELPKIYPIHKKFLNMKNKDIDIIKFNDRRFQLRGFKFIHEMDQIEDSTLDAQQLERSKISLKKRQSSVSLHNIFSELILKVNSIRNFIPIKNYKIKAYVEEGNNSRLIKQLLRKRVLIKLVSDKNQANLIWTRFSDFPSLDKTCKYSTQNIQKSSIISRAQEDYIQGYRKISQMQTPNNFTYPNKDIQLNDFFMHNHLKNHEELSDKKNLFKNIRIYCQKNNIDQATIIPKTFHIDFNNKKQGENQEKIDKIFQNKKFTENTFFVVKPGQDTNRGQGITVVIGRNSIMTAVQQLQKIGKSSLIQQYISPLLYKNRKFDIRCYALVTSVAGQLHAYWYKEGYLRTCCKQFNYDPSNIYGHLTNDAVQKKHKDYGKYQQANKLSFNDLQMILTQTQRDRDDVIKDMKYLVKHSIKSAEHMLRGQKNIIGFQIFGYDFLIDKDGKVWLIQINTNPCLQFAGSLLSRIIWHMVDNSIKIAVDPFLDIDQKKEYQNYLETNKFECII